MSMDFFDGCRYSCRMASRKTILLDPIACCTPVRTDVLDEAQAELLAHSFAALADPIRLRLLSHIAASDDVEVCACDLVEPSGRSQPTVSHHMKILVDAGLVEREKRGLWVWYRLVPSRLDALRSVLG
ncbi:MAG: ArsR family transcriptional regulator, arsenate/arsenite/antimonite-responsive transcriptional [Ilumatobacteraceae bacterium]